MNRTEQARRYLPERVPRVSGDEPFLVFAGIFAIARSPRQRG